MPKGIYKRKPRANASKQRRRVGTYTSPSGNAPVVVEHDALLTDDQKELNLSILREKKFSLELEISEVNRLIEAIK